MLATTHIGHQFDSWYSTKVNVVFCGYHSSTDNRLRHSNPNMEPTKSKVSFWSNVESDI